MISLMARLTVLSKHLGWSPFDRGAWFESDPARGIHRSTERLEHLHVLVHIMKYVKPSSPG